MRPKKAFANCTHNFLSVDKLTSGCSQGEERESSTGRKQPGRGRASRENTVIPKVQRAEEALELFVPHPPEASPRLCASVSPGEQCQGSPQLQEALEYRRAASHGLQHNRHTGVKYSYTPKRPQTSKHAWFSTEQQKELDFVMGLCSVFTQLPDFSVHRVG